MGFCRIIENFGDGSYLVEIKDDVSFVIGQIASIGEKIETLKTEYADIVLAIELCISYIKEDPNQGFDPDEPPEDPPDLPPDPDPHPGYIPGSDSYSGTVEGT